jgi:hypothetical protein
MKPTAKASALADWKASPRVAISFIAFPLLIWLDRALRRALVERPLEGRHCIEPSAMFSEWQLSAFVFFHIADRS